MNKDNLILTAFLAFIALALLAKSCITELEPIQPTKIIKFVDVTGRTVEFETDNPDPWEEVEHFKEFPNNPDLPPFPAPELLLCDSLVEMPEPFFLSLGAFLEPNLMFEPETATIQMGSCKDSFIVEGVLQTSFVEAVTSVTICWFSQTQNTFDSIIFKDNFGYNPDSMIIDPNFWMAIVGSTADESECPGLFIHFPEFALGIGCYLDEYSVGNAYIREDTLRTFFEMLPSVRTFSSGGVEVIDSVQLHDAIEVLVDLCQSVPDVPVSYAQLQGVGADTIQLDYLEQSGRNVNE
jgi:hypothetical protein